MKFKGFKKVIIAVSAGVLCCGSTIGTGLIANPVTAEAAVPMGLSPEEAIKEYGTVNYIIKFQVKGEKTDKAFPFIISPTGNTFTDEEGCGTFYGTYGDISFMEEIDEDGERYNLNNNAVFWLRDGEQINITLPRNTSNHSYTIDDPSWKYFESESRGIKFDLGAYKIKYDELENGKPIYNGSTFNFTPSAFQPARKSGTTQTMLITATTLIDVENVFIADSNYQHVLYKGDSETLTAKIYPENASNKNVTWTSSDTSVVTVSKDGIVKAVGKGTANVKVKTEDGGKTDTCKFLVKENSTESQPTTQPTTVTVVGVTLNKTSLELKKGSSEKLTATVKPDNAANKNITWTSSNASVATVTNGNVQAVGAGTAVITVKTANGGKTATCKITVPEDKPVETQPASVAVTGVTLNKTSLELKKGSSEKLTATVKPENASNKDVLWTNNNPSVLKVIGGNIKAVGVGTATVTVKTSDGKKTATCKVTVYDTATSQTQTENKTDNNVDIIENNDVSIYYKGNRNSKYTGLEGSSRGSRYFTNGLFNKDYNKLASCGGKWYVVRNGIIDLTYNGLWQAPNNGLWYYCTKGVIDKTFSGASTKPNGEVCYVRKGIASSYTGLEDNKAGSKYFTKGVFDTKYNKLAKYNGRWYVVKNGIIDLTYNGLWQAPNNGYWYYCTNGVLDKTVTNTISQNPSDNNWYYVNNGLTPSGYTGLGTLNNEKYYVNKGILDKNKTGLIYSPNEKEWLYVRRGKYDTSYTGIAQAPSGRWYYVKKGKYDPTYTGLAKSATGRWYYVRNGAYMTSFTGLAKAPSGRWYYVKNGKYDTTYTGLARAASGKWYYVKDGKYDTSFSGKVDYNGRAYTVKSGRVI